MGHASLSRRELLFGRTNPKDEVLSDEAGATAIEYGLIGGLIAVVLVTGLTRLGRRNRANYVCVTRAMRGTQQTRFCQRKGA